MTIYEPELLDALEGLEGLEGLGTAPFGATVWPICSTNTRPNLRTTEAPDGTPPAESNAGSI